MNRIARVLAWLVPFALLTGSAQAQLSLDGTVDAGQTVAQLAAAGGSVASVAVQAGAYVRAGDVVATLSAAPVFAPCDGTVEIIYADEGERADDATEKYGGALSIVPERRYAIYCSADYAYKSVRATHISAGQAVFLKCTADGSHRGTGIITEIDADTFTVSATGGAFYNGEAVNVYMEEDYDSADRVGRGTVVASAGEAVPADGEVARLYVSEGDFVEKGQLLMETLSAVPEDAFDGDWRLAAGRSGYVTAVYAEAGGAIERDAPLLELCPEDGIAVLVRVPEADIGRVHTGDAAAITFELAEETLRVAGTVASVSYLAETDAGGAVSYAVRVAFPLDDRIVPGMSAVVTFE